MDVFAVYFSGGKDAMAEYLRAHHSFNLDRHSGEEIDDAEAELELDEGKCEK